jgi:hypothetical protein
MEPGAISTAEPASASQSPRAEKVFRLEHCPGCGYSLAGSPDKGICPECGEEYDPQTIELTGEARGVHVTFANAATSQLKWMVLGRLIGVAILIAMAFGAGTGFVLLMIPSWCVGASLVCQRWTSGRAVVRVRMNAAGIVQDDNAEAPPWSETVRRIEMLIPLAFAGWLLAWGLAKMNWVCLVLAAIVGGSALWQLLNETRARRALLRVPQGDRLTRTSRRDLLKPSGWPDVLRFDIRPISDSRFGLVVTSTAVRRTSPDGDTADIEITCTSDQASEIQSRVTSWRDRWRDVDIQRARDRIRGSAVTRGTAGKPAG